MSQQTFPEPPIDLPIDGWLYEAHPTPGCRECAAAMRELGQAKQAGDASRRFEASRRVRSHPHRGGEVTRAPQRPKKRAGRTGYTHDGPPTMIEFLNSISTVCGVCFGHRQIYCPDCCGFRGCTECRYTYMVPCPECAGGDKEPIQW